MDITPLIHMAEHAGDIAMKYYGKNYLATETKEDQSPVTEADIAVNEYIVKYIKQHFAEHGLLSEESKDDLSRLDNEYVWCIDPIDGTKGFINHTGEFSILIGLLKNKQPHLGIVHVPVTGVTYFAQKGEGAWKQERDGEPISIAVNANKTLQDAHALISRSHATSATETVIDRLHIASRQKMGSLGLKIATIAAGGGDLYINTTAGAHEWDTCAPHIILTEAGGIITDLKGDSLHYNRKTPIHENGILVTANNTLHQNVLTEFPRSL